MAGLGIFGAGRGQIQKAVVPLLGAILVAVLLSSFAMPLAAHADSRTGACCIEATTGRVLYASGADIPMPMASTTKVLTAITVLEHLPLDKKVTICREAQGVEGSSVYLVAGETWTVRDLLYGLMLRSGNDCAVQLALSCAGSIPAFAAMMNDTAQRAGAYHSHFVNPHGLHDPDHYTTARDLALVTAYALRNATFAEIVSTKSYTYLHCSGEKRVFLNKNKMLSAYPGANGVKTGYTRVAGRCLVSSAGRDGMQLVCVVLNEYDMWQRSASIMDAAFATYRMRCLWSAGSPVALRLEGRYTLVTVPHTLCYPLSDDEVSRLRYDYATTPHVADMARVTVTLDGSPICTSSLLPAQL